MLAGIQFLLFYLLVRVPSRFKIICVCTFLIISILIRLLALPEEFADYDSYYKSIAQGFVEYSFPVFLFSEPYLHLLSSSLSLISKEVDIIVSLVYWWNFSIVTLFFVFLGLKNEIKPEYKIIAFGLYYFFWGFVLLRNSVGYMLFGLFIINPSISNRFKIIMSGLAHVSIFPVVLGTINKFNLFKRINFQPVVRTAFLFISGYLISKLVMSPWLIDFDTLGRLATYFKDNANYSAGHVVFFCLVNFFFLFQMKLLSRARVKPDLLYLIYVGSFFINPVISSRFSVYLILYLLLSTNTRFYSSNKFLKLIGRKPTNSVLYILSFVIHVYSFYDLQV